MKPIVLLLIPCLLLCSCHHIDEDEIVAKAYGHILYRDDIANVVPAGVSDDDSIALLTTYVNQWVDQMVLVSKAEKNIKDDFTEQLENYRNTLITYAYEQQILSQNLDTVIYDSEIKQYYNDHRDDYVLLSPIARVIYIKLPIGDPNHNRIERLMSAQKLNDDDILNLQRMAAKSAIEMSFDYEKWLPVVDLRGRVPASVIKSLGSSDNSHFSSLTDTAGICLVHFLETRLTNDYAPVEVEYDNIKTIILNRRKQEMIKRMRQDLRREADNSGKVTINL